MPPSPDSSAEALATVDDPACLTPDERRRQVAAILARGILRLRGLPPLPPDSAPPGDPHEPPDSCQKALEWSAASSPHAPRG